MDPKWRWHRGERIKSAKTILTAETGLPPSPVRILPNCSVLT
jgi:hypothetical protein